MCNSMAIITMRWLCNIETVHAVGWHVVNTMYLIWVPFLGEDVSNESLLHFFLLYQKLPQTLHWQR